LSFLPVSLPLLLQVQNLDRFFSFLHASPDLPPHKAVLGFCSKGPFFFQVLCLFPPVLVVPKLSMLFICLPRSLPFFWPSLPLLFFFWFCSFGLMHHIPFSLVVLVFCSLVRSENFLTRKQLLSPVPSFFCWGGQVHRSFT